MVRHTLFDHVSNSRWDGDYLRTYNVITGLIKLFFRLVNIVHARLRLVLLSLYSFFGLVLVLSLAVGIVDSRSALSSLFVKRISA